tara:strand:+ start:7213 stop:7452 length:240 start_codon:yes stop_codon:yes gene_type:complete
MLLADGFEEAVIGYIDRMNEPRVVVYDREKCIDILSKDMDRDEAEEYFEYNVAGSYMGAETPAYLHKASIETIHELAGA